MKILFLQLLFLAFFVIVHCGHIQKVAGVKDAHGKCICTMQLSHLSFPVRKVEQLEGDFYNLTDHLQNVLEKLYIYHWIVTDGLTNLTDMDKRAKYAKDYGGHVDLEFNKLIEEIYTMMSLARNITENTTSPEVKDLAIKLVQEINGIAGVIINMEKRDKANIITAQREIDVLRKKLLECEELIVHIPATVKNKTVFGMCEHEGLQSVSSPVLVKLNWKGSEFKGGAWGKDSALHNQLNDHHWVFPMNTDGRTLEIFRLYSSFQKLLLYSPTMEYSLPSASSEGKCEICGQGAGVTLYNGSFYYNCYDSRSLCKADPFNHQVSKRELEDQDPASFNNWFSYKNIQYQDMDMAGDENGLWMVHGSTMANGKAVIRKVNPDSLKVGRPWITTQAKNELTNTFMICGVLYATKLINSTHEMIFYYYDTNTAKEGNMKVYLQKLLPTVQSLDYNPNDERLYMFNDGYLVYYNITFKDHIEVVSRGGKTLPFDHRQDSDSEEGQSLVGKGVQTVTDQKDQDSVKTMQVDFLSKGASDAKHEEEQAVTTTIRKEAGRESSQLVATE